MGQRVGYAVRRILRNRQLVLAVVTPLSIGLGAALAVFSLLQGLLFGKIGLPGSDNLVTLSLKVPELGTNAPFSAATFLTLLEHQRVFSHLTAYRTVERTLNGRGEALRIEVAQVSPEFFYLASSAPLLGRTLRTEDGVLSQQAGSVVLDGRTTVLSETLWRSRFESDPSIVGKIAQFDGIDFEIVGVMPASLDFPTSTAAWIPLVWGHVAPNDFGGFYFQVLACPINRLEDAKSQRIREDLTRIARILDPMAPGITGGIGIESLSLRERLTGNQELRVRLLFLLTLVIVASIAVSNTQLLGARNLAQRRSFSTRMALGASLGSLYRDVVLEVLILTTLGTVLALLLTLTCLAIFAEVLPVVGLKGVEPSIGVLGFLLVVMLAAFCILPSGIGGILALRRLQLEQALNEGSTLFPESIQSRLISRIFVFSQSLVSVVLVAVMALTGLHLRLLHRIELGIDAERLTAVDFNLSRDRYSPQQVYDFGDEGLERLKGRPFVLKAALAMRSPILDEGGGIWFRRTEGDAAGQPSQFPATFNSVSEGFFSTVGLPILSGRSFEAEDRLGAEAVAIVDQELASQQYPGEDPVGQSIILTPWPDIRRRIVGVVASVRYGGVRREPEPTIYVPFRQIPAGRLRFLLLSDTEDELVVESVRRLIWELDPLLGLDATGSLAGRIEDSHLPDVWALRFVSVLAALGLLASAAGVYSSSAHSVERRRHELGIRAAVGASPASLIVMVVREHLIYVASGLISGALIFTLLRDQLRSLELRTDSSALALSTAILIVGLVSAGAASVAAIGVARIDASSTIRQCDKAL